MDLTYNDLSFLMINIDLSTFIIFKHGLRIIINTKFNVTYII